MRIDKGKQDGLRVRAMIAKLRGVKWSSNFQGTYDPEDKLKKAWITTHLSRQERNKKRRLELGEEPMFKAIKGEHDASNI